MGTQFAIPSFQTVVSGVNVPFFNKANKAAVSTGPHCCPFCMYFHVLIICDCLSMCE
jgi:hypothetical protein